MLGEMGIQVSPESLFEEPPPPYEPAPSSPSYCPPSPTYEEYKALPSFQHLTHVQPERPRVPYKRTTHFAAHLAQVTGRVSTLSLPPGIVRRLRRAGVKPTKPDSYFRIRRLLKKWGNSSPEYRCIFTLLKKMGGPVVTLSYEQERAIRQDFEQLSRLWDRQKPLGETRKNFPSYYLVVQLLFKKHGIQSFYTLPSIKDTKKFDSIVEAYQQVTHSTCSSQ